VAEAAEQIRQVLRSRGPMLVVRAAQMTALPEDLARQGLGWLAREGQVALRSKADGRELEVGRAAGVIWRLARSRGTVARKDISRATGLPAGLVNEAIGWLVREGKLVVEERRQDRSVRAVTPAGSGSSMPSAESVSPPSQIEAPAKRGRSLPLPLAPGGTLALEKKGKGRDVSIGDAAGSIWRTLNLQGHLSAKELSQETGLAEGLLDQGIGWLAREGKLIIGRDRKGHEWFRLNGA
jgi:hypothetical protein